MPPFDAHPAEPNPLPSGWNASGEPAQTEAPGLVQRTWQAVHHHWLVQRHELHLFLEAQARAAVLGQAGHYCNELADWAVRLLFGQLEHLHLPPRIMQVASAAATHQGHVFCSALMAHLQTQAGVLQSGGRQALGEEDPSWEAAMAPAVWQLQVPANAPAAWQFCGHLDEAAHGWPPQAVHEVVLVGEWNNSEDLPF